MKHVRLLQLGSFCRGGWVTGLVFFFLVTYEEFMMTLEADIYDDVGDDLSLYSSFSLVGLRCLVMVITELCPKAQGS